MECRTHCLPSHILWKRGAYCWKHLRFVWREMLRLVHLVLVVSIFRLERVGTTSLCDEEPQLCIHTELKEELSSNGSSVPSKAEALESPGHIGHVSTLMSYECIICMWMFRALNFPFFWNKINTWGTYYCLPTHLFYAFVIYCNKEK